MRTQLHVLILLVSLVSCGKSGDSDSDNRDSIQAEEAARAAIDGSNIQGTYLAKFTTLNAQVVGTIPGSAQLKRDEDKLYAYLRLFAGSPSVAHFQNIHIGSRCPDMTDDKNMDGFLDYPETLAAVGSVIVPLDWDLNSQTAGNRSWPKAFPNGSYEYLKIANFNSFFKDLKKKDSNDKDQIIKLAEDQGLSIEGKVVIVQGVSADKVLPETVAGFGKYQNIQTLPIACGVFKAGNPETGIDYEESIPGPIASVEEGQDQPAPVGANEIPGSGTVITGGPSNDAGSNDSTPEDETPEEQEPNIF
jgi:hypothetical protein